MELRQAQPADLEPLTRLFTEAFGADPLWRWAFPGDDGLEAMWRLYIGSALRYPATWIAGDFAAASLWIPPGGEELTPEEEERVEPLLEGHVGPRTPDVLELLDRFDGSHPRAEPHYYLSLLGTATAHRGRGLGMALLRENLRRMDDEGVPAYLESSNPANDERYAGVGFRGVSRFTTPDDARTVTGMWRAVGGPSVAAAPARQ